MREIECCFGGGSDPGAASVLIPCEGESRGKTPATIEDDWQKNNLCDPPWICSRKGMTENPFRGNKRKQRERDTTEEKKHFRESSESQKREHRVSCPKICSWITFNAAKRAGRHFCPE